MGVRQVGPGRWVRGQGVKRGDVRVLQSSLRGLSHPHLMNSFPGHRCPQGEVAWSRIKDEEERSCRSGEDSASRGLIQGNVTKQAAARKRQKALMLKKKKRLLEPSRLIQVQEN